MAEKYTRENILEILKWVVDPEMGMNIVDLGLVYDIDITDDHVQVDFTLTSPYCPLEEHMMMSVSEAVQSATGLKCYPNLVWSPPWSMERLSEEARIAFGIQ